MGENFLSKDPIPSVELAKVKYGIDIIVHGVVYCVETDDCGNERHWAKNATLSQYLTREQDIKLRLGPPWWSFLWAVWDIDQFSHKYGELLIELSATMIDQMKNVYGATYYCEI